MRSLLLFHRPLIAFVLQLSFVGAFVTITRRQESSSPLTPLYSQKTAVIAGATGYIGRSVVRESVRQGYRTIALVRDADKAKEPSLSKYFEGAQVLECDVCDADEVKESLAAVTNKYGRIEGIVSCLASRSGIKKDAYKIDYQSTLNLLRAGQFVGAAHFCLLSAFCVRNPLLQFQRAKLKFEAALQDQTDMRWSIVRPTAFFKSVSGQFENLKAGKPCVLFGNGESAPCNPIAETDLATYMMDCFQEPSRHNRILDIGGRGEPVTHKTYNGMMFKALGLEPKYVNVPVVTFDVIINMFEFLRKVTGSEKMENAAETARIVKYYAVVPMLTTADDEKFGNVKLEDFYQKIAEEGQEFDPYVSFYSSPVEETAAVADFSVR